MDRLITNVPGMEGFLRCRDLPSFCRVSDLMDPQLLLFAVGVGKIGFGSGSSQSDRVSGCSS